MAIPTSPDFVQAAPTFRAVQWDGTDEAKTKITQFMAAVMSIRQEFIGTVVQSVNEDGSFVFDQNGLFNWLSTVPLNWWIAFGPNFGTYIGSANLAMMNPDDFAVRFPDWETQQAAFGA